MYLIVTGLIVFPTFLQKFKFEIIESLTSIQRFFSPFFPNEKGNPNAEWVKQRDTAEDICWGTAKIKSGADYSAKKVKEAAIDVEDEIIEETGTDIDAPKSGAAKVWDQTKDMAENVTNSAYNMGSDLCGAVKHGAEVGWNKVAGD